MCHMGSHSVTCHPPEARISPLPPAEAGTWFRDPIGMQGCVDLCYVKADRLGIECVPCQSQVQRTRAAQPCCYTLALLFFTCLSYSLLLSELPTSTWVDIALHLWPFVFDIAIFVRKRDALTCGFTAGWVVSPNTEPLGYLAGNRRAMLNKERHFHVL